MSESEYSSSEAESEQEVNVFDLPDSDEEMLNDFKKYHHLKEDQSDQESVAESEEEGWGSKQNYYDADELSGDEAKEEEKEALRLQQKQIQDLNNSDFEDDFEHLVKRPTQLIDSTIQTQITNLSDKDKDTLLHTKMPDVVKYHSLLKTLDTNSLGGALYAANIVFFLALAASDEGRHRAAHPVFKQLEAFESLIEKSRAFLAASPDSESEIDDVPLDEELASDVEGQEEDLESGSESEAFEDASMMMSEFESEGESDEVGDDENPKIVLESYEPLKSRRKRTKDDAFGEVEGLTEADLRDKQGRKKSLQFHINRVDQSLAKDLSKGKGGDIDVPYKSKAKIEVPELDVDAEELDNGSESEGEGEQTATDIYGSISDHSDSEDEDVAAGSEEEDPEADAFYAEISQLKKQRKSEREAFHTELHAPLELPAEEALEADDKRIASRKILSNRGLTPHRKKENRNPRVKRRNQYERAKKKLSSTKRVAVDKSKVGKYAGEKTGIKANLARSVKF